MKITIITLFPEMFDGFLNNSIVKRAQEAGLVEVELVQLRDFAAGAYKSVDDRPFGGGPGMLLMAEPVMSALEKYKTDESYSVFTSAQGAVFNQQKARDLSQKKHLLILAGHYEGLDERAVDEFDEELSVGDYVLTGGELPAAIIVDAVVRLLPGVLKKDEATKSESFEDIADELIEGTKYSGKLLEHPQYTRPQEVNGKKVPDVLLSGHHEEIQKWKKRESLQRTLKNRPDLLKKSS